MHVAMLAYPDMTQLDLTGPFEVFAKAREMTIDLVWKTLDPVRDGSGLTILPTATLAECPSTDILFVPGGPGQIALMDDAEVLGFIAMAARGARYVTSVCTGSLLLAAAGLLSGRRAACHWGALDQLELFGALPSGERVVFDGNVVTGAGVTSGIDFALALVAAIYGDERAQAIQLGMEYDPEPPFPAGSPRTAPPELIAAQREAMAGFQAPRRVASERAAARLTNRPAGSAY